MQTAWPGFGLAPSNVVSDTTEVLDPWTIRVRLSAVPGLVTRVTLDAQTQGVRLYTADEPVRFAVDTDPAQAPVLTDATIAASAFVVGDTLLPETWHLVALPGDALTHVLHLTSQGDAAPTVLVVALLEG